MTLTAQTIQETTRRNPILSRLIHNNPCAAATLESKETDSGTEIYLYDVIDAQYGISARAFGKALETAQGGVTLRVNSPGGDVFEGRAMASLVRNYGGDVQVVVDGLCASAATTVALAAPRVTMMRGAFLMVHRAWSLALGNAADMRQMAGLLEKIDGEIAADYANKAGVGADVALAWMEAETWFTAEEAVDKRLADQLSEGGISARLFNLDVYDRVPEALLRRDQRDDDAQSIAAWEKSQRRLRLLERMA